MHALGTMEQGRAGLATLGVALVLGALTLSGCGGGGENPSKLVGWPVLSSTGHLTAEFFFSNFLNKRFSEK